MATVPSLPQSTLTRRTRGSRPLRGSGYSSELRHQDCEGRAEQGRAEGAVCHPLTPRAELSSVSVPTSLELSGEAAEAAGCPVFLSMKVAH